MGAVELRLKQNRARHLSLKARSGIAAPAFTVHSAIRTSLALLFIACCTASFAQAPRTLPAVFLPSAPKIDGTLDDVAWKIAAKADGFVEKYSGKPLPDTTEAWIGYDNDAIYVAFYCRVADPKSIVAREIRPGADFEGEDAVSFSFDPYFERTGASSEYMVNALGTQSDRISQGASGKREWRGEWQAAAMRVSDGYIVEMRIPWRILNYPAGKAPRNMTINFVRQHGLSNLQTIWSNTTSAERPQLDGIWQGVIPPARKERPKVQYLAYGLADLNATDNSYTPDAGLDVRFPMTTQLTLVGAINPDFKNVEQQIAGIEFTRSERFLSDARPFFAEGSNLLRLTADFAVGTMFYSRRIEDFDVGAKAFGKLTPSLSVGALTTYWTPNRDSDTVINVSKQFGPDAAASFFGTSHLIAGGQNNLIGVTGFLKRGSFFLNGEAMREFDTNYTASAADIQLGYQAPKWLVLGNLETIDPQFNPALAFVQFNDRRGWWFYSQYQNQFVRSRINEIRAELAISRFEHFDGSSFERTGSIDLSLRSSDDRLLEMGFDKGSFEKQNDEVYSLAYTLGASNRFRTYGVAYQWGKRNDAPFRYEAAEVTRRILKKLDVGFGFSRIADFEGANTQTFVTFGWEYDAKRALTGRIVVTGNRSNAFLAYRSSGFAGNEMFIILGEPNADNIKKRAAIKFVWPF